MPVIWKFRNVFPDIIVHREQALFRRQHDTGRSELFRHRGHVKHGVRTQRSIELQVRFTVRLPKDETAVANYTNGTAGGVRVAIGSKNLVDFLWSNINRGCRNDRENEKDGYYYSPHQTCFRS